MTLPPSASTTEQPPLHQRRCWVGFYEPSKRGKQNQWWRLLSAVGLMLCSDITFKGGRNWNWGMCKSFTSCSDCQTSKIQRTTEIARISGTRTGGVYRNSHKESSGWHGSQSALESSSVLEQSTWKTKNHWNAKYQKYKKKKICNHPGPETVELSTYKR